jgi:hypothetical protein
MICNLAVYIRDLSLIDEAEFIVNYETFLSFYQTPTSFPLQPLADTMHEHLTVKAFSLDIHVLLLHMWPNEVIAMKAASASASDYKP